MQKFFTFIFALWLTVGSTCAVKAEVLNYIPQAPQKESFTHAEKSGDLVFYAQDAKVCTHSFTNPIDEFTVPASILSSLPHGFLGLLFSCATTLFLSFFLFKKRKKQKINHSITPKLFGPPLFLQFHRLQFYA